MAQSVIRIASVGIVGDPEMPLAFEKSSQVPRDMVSSGPR